jgi:arylsulfatase A-like enzyme
MRKPNILLIVMDCVRFDYPSVYGDSRSETPNLERLAADGVLFQNAFAAAPWTPPSHASLFAGTYPSRHGVDVGENLYLNDHNRTLAEMLVESGYRTFGILPDAHLSALRGFDRGFQETVELWRIPHLNWEYDWLNCLTWNAIHGKDTRSRYATKALQRWLKSNFQKSNPFFAFINFKAAHNRYEPPQPFKREFEIASAELNRKKAQYYSNKGGYSYMGGRLELTEEEFTLVRSWYSGAVAYIDYRIGEIVETLKTIGAYDNTLIIVTADHGENFGEHHLAYHLFCLYDTLMHVPLLMSCPALLPRGTTVSGLVSLTDIVPTIIDVAGLKERQDHLQGRSLVPFEERRYNDHVFAEFGRPYHMLHRLNAEFPGHEFSRFDKGLQCIRTEEYKLIVSSNGEEELYRLRDDPLEVSNRSDELPEIAVDLRAKLTKWRASMDGDPASELEADDESVMQSLRDLGYF